MIYSYDNTGKITFKSNRIKKEPFITSDLNVDINGYYVLDGILTPRVETDFVSVPRSLLADEELEILCGAGCAISIVGPHEAISFISTDEIFTFVSGVPGDYNFTFEKIPYIKIKKRIAVK